MNIEFGDIIAILALIISLINLIIYFINNKKKIEINLNTYRFTKLPKGYFYIFNVQIVNKSRTPIAIKGINCNGSDNPPIPYLVKENTRRSGKEKFKTWKGDNKIILGFKNDKMFPIYNFNKRKE